MSAVNDRGKILLVEDDLRVQLNNQEILERHGYTVLLAMDLAEARKVVANMRPDAVVLDISLPDGDGVGFLEEIRQNLAIPVLVLTAAQAAQNAVASFNAGADDYLRKPYDLREFRARVDALLRRAARMPEIVAAGHLQLDLLAFQGFFKGRDLLLTQKEFALLSCFVQNEGKSMSAEYIYEKIWRQSKVKDDTSLKNLVYKLRKKLSGSDYSITNDRNQGYSFKRL